MSGVRYSATRSEASPPSHAATASRCATSTGMAMDAWMPVEACSDIAQVAAMPAATTPPPTARPKVRSFFSRSSSRRAYVPNSTAMNRAAAPSSSSRETRAAPGLVSRTDWSPARSKASENFPLPVYGLRSSSMTRVAAVSVSQPRTTSRCIGRADAPPRQQIRTNALPPTSSTNPPYAA